MVVKLFLQVEVHFALFFAHLEHVLDVAELSFRDVFEAFLKHLDLRAEILDT